MRRRALVVVFALSVTACGGGGGRDTVEGASTATQPEIETETETETETAAGHPEPRVTPASAASPIGNVLVHVEDDDGTTPGDGADARLLFEPGDVATLYVQDAESTLVAHGSWYYDGGELALAFDGDQLTMDVTAPFDLRADNVELPFRLFSGGTAGTSTWERRPADALDDVRAIFRAAVLDETDPYETAAAVDRATAYVQTIVDLDLADASGRARATASPAAVAVRSISNGVEVEYSDGTTAQALLFAWAPAGPDALSLSTAALASDPRVHLDANANSHTQDDPTNKTAMFVVPLMSARINDWWDGLLNKARDTGVVGKTSDGFDFDTAEETLIERGYDVARYEDTDACVECLIEAFAEHKNPGIVVYQTHGSSNGYLLAGDQLSTSGDHETAHAQFVELQATLREEGYATLVDTPDALVMMSIEVEYKVPEGVAWFAAVGPGFWQWLHDEKNVDFSQSLFYAAACDADQAEALRTSIGARAFFGFKAPVSPHLAGGMFNYMVAQLARRTRSAEEVFYNVVRVVNTGEMIYVEDKLLDGIVPTDADGKQPLFADPESFVFNGYGNNAPFALGGWFDTSSVSQTQVWWLMFAARWNEDPDAGVQNLVTCNTDYWSQGEYGGLGSPFCNAANDGDLPAEADVGYATYLMTGTASHATTAPIARFTLNEGA